VRLALTWLGVGGGRRIGVGGREAAIQIRQGNQTGTHTDIQARVKRRDCLPASYLSWLESA